MAAAMKLDKLKEKARLMTRKALESYPDLPDEYRKKLTMIVRFDGLFRIFELYVGADDPSNDIILAQARLHSKTAEGSVKVFSENWEKLTKL